MEVENCVLFSEACSHVLTMELLRGETVNEAHSPVTDKSQTDTVGEGFLLLGGMSVTGGRSPLSGRGPKQQTRILRST